MNALLANLTATYPGFHFCEADSFYWSPETSQVFYKSNTRPNEQWSWRLLHETGHAILGHTSYKSDLQLLHMEVSAWEKAQKLASSFQIIIDPNYLQDCLDTYRDWLHKRSTCPTCNTHSLQETSVRYRCFNCNTTWQVSASRFCRPYRRHLSSIK